MVRGVGVIGGIILLLLTIEMYYYWTGAPFYTSPQEHALLKKHGILVKTVKIPDGYRKFSNITVINGKPAYVIESETTSISKVVYGDTIYGDYRAIVSPLLPYENGIAFVATTVEEPGNVRYTMLLNDKKLGPYLNYKSQAPLTHNLTVDDGKFLWRTQREDGKSVVIYDGKEIGGYDSDVDIKDFDVLNGKVTLLLKESSNDIIDNKLSIGEKELAVVAREIGNYVIYDKQTIGGPYEDVSQIFITNGTPGFIAQRGKKYIFYHDNYFEEYDEFIDSCPLEKNNIVLFLPGKNGTSVWHNGRSLGPFQQIIYSDFSCGASLINGMLTFFIQEDNKRFVIHGNKRLGPYDFDEMYFIPYDGKTLLFLGRKQHNHKDFLIQDGKEIFSTENHLEDIQVIEKKIIFKVVGKERSVFYDGKIVETPYGKPTDYYPLNKGILYTIPLSSKEKKSFQIVYNNTLLGTTEEPISYGVCDPWNMCEGGDVSVSHNVLEISDNIAIPIKENDLWYVQYKNHKWGPYTEARNLTNFHDSVMFVAQKNEQGYLVIDGQELGRFDPGFIWNPPHAVLFNSHIFFVGRRVENDDEKYFIMKDNQKVSPEYDGLQGPFLRQDHLYFVAEEWGHSYTRRSWIIREDGNRVTKNDYRKVWITGFFDEKNQPLHYTVEEYPRWHVMHGGEKIGPYYYESLSNMRFSNGKILVTAWNGAQESTIEIAP